MEQLYTLCILPHTVYVPAHKLLLLPLTTHQLGQPATWRVQGASANTHTAHNLAQNEVAGPQPSNTMIL